MSQNISRTPFFHRNQVRKRRVAMATVGVMAGITAATLFLCVRPTMAQQGVAALPVTDSAHADQPERRAMHEGQAAVAALGGAERPPGSLLSADREGLVLRCGEGALRLTTVQREGGRPMAAADYLNARPQLRTA